MSVPEASVCPCDDHRPRTPINPSGLDRIAFRAGTYREFRRALLATSQTGPLAPWRPGGEGDLAVMTAEWWAYLADILTFYNEEIANQGYLRTAQRPESVRRLVSLLGYRPRPAIGARGVLGALLEPGSRGAVLPKGMQFQNKPGPGQTVQTFELDAETTLGPIDAVPARPVERLLWPQANVLMLEGEVRDIDPGQLLLLRPRAGGSPVLATVTQASIVTLRDRRRRTRLVVSLSSALPAGARADDYRLERARDISGLWTALGSGVPDNGGTSHYYLHLPGRIRQLNLSDPLMLTAPGLTPRLTFVYDMFENVWYANGVGGDPTDPPVSPKVPVPIPHSVLFIWDGIDDTWRSRASSISVTYGWAEAGRLRDQEQETWTGAVAAIEAVAPKRFRSGLAQPALIEGADGLGVDAKVGWTGSGAGTVSGLPTTVPETTTPLRVLYNRLPVSRGKTVRDEILGSGDARLPGQAFKLGKSPVTWLAKGSSWASTIEIRVGGRPWTEVASFYAQKPDARVFVSREDVDGVTYVMFGDGEHGARLPTGVNNVVATYRIGAGAESPPAGKLTIVAKPAPGLVAVRNPVAVGGGADPDPPHQIKRYGPRSVLTFGRAVSVLDYEAIAAGAPGVTRARAAWAWDETRQTTAVTLYVGDDQAAVDSVTDALGAAAGDRLAPTVQLAKPVETLLGLKIEIIPGMDGPLIAEAVKAALIGDGALFSPRGLSIGQPVFDSAIMAAVLAVEGTVAVTYSLLAHHVPGQPWAISTAAVHPIPEDGWFELRPEWIFVITVPSENVHG